MNERDKAVITLCKSLAYFQSELKKLLINHTNNGQKFINNFKTIIH